MVLNPDGTFSLTQAEIDLGDALLAMDKLNVKFGGHFANTGLSRQMNEQFNRNLTLMVEAREREKAHA